MSQQLHPYSPTATDHGRAHLPDSIRENQPAANDAVHARQVHAYPAKRWFDFGVAAAACALFAPLMLLVALVKWLEDGRSPLFLQVRVGRARRPFTVIKLRTMADDRVTRLGGVLRRTGLDEVPQFINVLKGDMSIIGPRPLTAYDVDRLGWGSPSMDWRFAVNPGITGLSQLLAGRSARLSRRLDRLYFRNSGMLRDLQLTAISAAVAGFGKRRVRRWLCRGRTL